MIALLVLLVAPPSDLGPTVPMGRWWEQGHHAVAALAWNRLGPAARAKARDLLAGDDFIQVSTWADSIRPFRRESGPWHYVNVPIWAPRYDPDTHCPGGDCVIGAIEKFRKVLADESASAHDRGEALRFVIHFVGDLHQPLHAGDRSDRGGNDTKVYRNGRETNLHAIWDGAVVEMLATNQAGLIARLQASMATVPPETLAAWSQDPVMVWAEEGRNISRDHAYRLPSDGTIDTEYLIAKREVVETALLKAGVRLAAVLETALSR